MGFIKKIREDYRSERKAEKRVQQVIRREVKKGTFDDDYGSGPMTKHQKKSTNEA